MNLLSLTLKFSMLMHSLFSFFMVGTLAIAKAQLLQKVPGKTNYRVSRGYEDKKGRELHVYRTRFGK